MTASVSPETCRAELKRLINEKIVATCRLCTSLPDNIQGTAVAQWLRCCATNRKLAGSIPDCVIGIFH